MKLSTRYNRVNLFTSLVMLAITGAIYYAVIHLILTAKLDRDLAVEEDEIRQYVARYHKLPLATDYLDQQIDFKALEPRQPLLRKFENTSYYNASEDEKEPGRRLVTWVRLGNKTYQVLISKSRMEAESLVRIIVLVTLGVTVLLLAAMALANRLLLSRLWKPFYQVLGQMKTYDLAKKDHINGQDTDIDEFRELNESALAMATRVRRDYNELKSFADNASHEMMTPLAVINSKLDSLLQTGPFTPEQGAILEDLYHGVGRLFRLNQSLLLLAKIENNLIPDLQEVDMQDLIESKIRQFQELFEKDGLTVVHQLEPYSVKMSKYMADILLNNLLSNAIRHNHPQGKVTITLENKLLQVCNTGKEATLAPNLFERFTKGASSEGLGLGLAIVKQLCTLYGFGISYVYLQNQHSFIIDFQPPAN